VTEIVQTPLPAQAMIYYYLTLALLLYIFMQFGLKYFFFSTLTVFGIKNYAYKAAWILPVKLQKKWGFLEDYEDVFGGSASAEGRFEDFERKRT